MTDTRLIGEARQASGWTDFAVDLATGEVRFGDAVGGTEIGGIGPGVGSLRLVPERYGIFGKQDVTRICTAGCAGKRAGIAVRVDGLSMIRGTEAVNGAAGEQQNSRS